MLSNLPPGVTDSMIESFCESDAAYERVADKIYAIMNEHINEGNLTKFDFIEMFKELTSQLELEVTCKHEILATVYGYIENNLVEVDQYCVECGLRKGEIK